MSRVLKDLKVRVGDDLREKLNHISPGFTDFRILRKSVDARRSGSPHFVYTIEIFESGETMQPIDLTPPQVQWKGAKPIIVGAGPAGLFAAMRFVERGIPCILLERGSAAEKRILAINKFWRYGEINEDDNVCFGEGGAGLYSDGKLITRIKSPYIPYVMDRLVQFGAPEEIRFLANPHVGSDRIRRVIPKMRKFLLEMGCEIRFNSPVEKLIFDQDQVCGVITRNGERLESDSVILATGHSATDILDHLFKSGVKTEGKSFALGLRVEHPQHLINQIQFREHSESQDLGAANYRLVYNDQVTGLGVYSFCMCPGGYVLSSGTEADSVVCNGMSNYNRNSKFANSAIVITIEHDQMFGNDIMGGMDFRRKIEKRAFDAVVKSGGKKEIPTQRLIDFMLGRNRGLNPSSSLSGNAEVRMDEILPSKFVLELHKAFEHFHEKMRGFIHPEANLHGIESRTSCPVRITRNPVSLESVSHKGLYPTGEGAGYAGGITSAACDGIRAAEAIVAKMTGQTLDSTTDGNPNAVDADSEGFNSWMTNS